MNRPKPKTVRTIFFSVGIIAGIVGLMGSLYNSIPLMVACVVVIMAMMLFYYIFYRCPHCGKYLDRTTGPFCPRCGKRIND